MSLFSWLPLSFSRILNRRDKKTSEIKSIPQILINYARSPSAKSKKDEKQVVRYLIALIFNFSSLNFLLSHSCSSNIIYFDFSFTLLLCENNINEIYI